MSQNAKILEYLHSHVGITQAQATDIFHCYRLGARIHDLRRMGHNITTIDHTTKNEDGNTVNYAEYRLCRG